MESLWMAGEETVCRLTLESSTRPSTAIQQNSTLQVDHFSKTIYSIESNEYTYWYFFELTNWRFLYSFNTMYEISWLITPDQFIFIAK
jgi:hypothetical protein